MLSRAAICLAALLLASCAGRAQLSGGADVHVMPGDGLPAPTKTDLFEQNRPYLIGPFDKLTIDVFGIADLSQKEVQIDASGRLSFPLVGTIEASGKTPGELAEVIEARLRAGFVKNPQVTVNLKETVSQVITVDGEVREPGLYPVVGRMTLMRAIATAKGLGEYARMDDVVVFRTVNGQKMAALYNLRAIRRGSYSDPELYANDIIVVGDSQARRIFKDLLAAGTILSYVAVAVLK